MNSILSQYTLHDLTESGILDCDESLNPSYLIRVAKWTHKYNNLYKFFKYNTSRTCFLSLYEVCFELTRIFLQESEHNIESFDGGDIDDIIRCIFNHNSIVSISVNINNKNQNINDLIVKFNYKITIDDLFDCESESGDEIPYREIEKQKERERESVCVRQGIIREYFKKSLNCLRVVL